jgi:DNA-binding MarR family transcriptional regulator
MGFVWDHPGRRYEADPGDVLKQIAEAIRSDYTGVALAVRELEDIGFINVSRTTLVDRQRGNRIKAIAAAGGPTLSRRPTM